MPGRSPEALQSDVDRWLASLGFSRGNPFATAEADQERALLPEFFVDVDGYERIKSDRTVITFAPRGGGKSALRVVLASQAAPISPEATTLVVEYTDFDALIAKQRSGRRPSIDEHIPWLLRAATRALWETVCGTPSPQHSTEAPVANRWYRMPRMVSVDAPARFRLAQLVRNYYPALLDPTSLYERFSVFDPAIAYDWTAFTDAAASRHLRAFLETRPGGAEAIAYLLADVNDCPDAPGDPMVTPVERMLSFVRLAHTMNLSAVHFLVDRIDEYQETADDPGAQADILEPLLAHLPLLEMPGLAFKFFLSQETRDLLFERPTIRRDRLNDQVVTVQWDQGRLKHLLNERLEVYSDGQIHDLVELCQETRVEGGHEPSVRPLGEWIEAEMMQLAQGSPRRLLIAVQLLCQAHVRRRGMTGLLEREDWEVARTELMRKMPPLLRLHKDSPAVRVGDHEIQLTVQQHKILLTLAAALGRCKREDLVVGVWQVKLGEGITEAAVDQAVGRLRERLGDSSEHPVYLETIRKDGFVLKNYELD